MRGKARAPGEATRTASSASDDTVSVAAARLRAVELAAPPRHSNEGDGLADTRDRTRLSRATREDSVENTRVKPGVDSPGRTLRTPLARTDQAALWLLLPLTSILAWVTGVHAANLDLTGGPYGYFGYLDLLILVVAAAGVISCTWALVRILRRSGRRVATWSVTLGLTIAATVATVTIPFVLPNICFSFEVSGGQELGTARYCGITAGIQIATNQAEPVSADWLWGLGSEHQIPRTAASLAATFALIVVILLMARARGVGGV